jgi:uncharacterized membrane protein
MDESRNMVHDEIFRALRRYVFTGLLTALPLWITWVVFDFVLALLARAGRPAIQPLATAFETSEAVVSQWLLHPVTQFAASALITVLALCLLGFLATRVVGRRLIDWIETGLERLPLIQTVYGSTKRLLEALRSRPEGVKRVVLIPFPSPEMKAVGLVTRTFIDKGTGREIAAVYVPTTPNPTSGYLELVPVDRLTPTDWTMDEAMAFIVTGGAAGPEQLQYEKSDDSATAGTAE